MAQGQQLRAATKNLAQFTKELASQTQDEMNKLHKLIKQQNEVLGACIRLLGFNEVQTALDEMRVEAGQKALQKQIDGIKALVDKNILVPSEVIESTGFIVGIDTLKDGTQHRVQFEMAGVNPEFHQLYLGKKAGDVIEGANGSKMTIGEVYQVDQAVAEKVLKSSEATPEAPAENTDAAQAAAQ